MKKSDVFKITLTNDIYYLPIVQVCIREIAKKIGFDDEDIYKIELGLEETYTNIIKHAFEDDEDNTFEIICEHIPKGIRIIFKEKGIPFDPNRLPHFSLAEEIDDISSSGLGTYLTKEVMDEVLFRNLGPQGKETHLVKYLKSRNIRESLTEAELKPEIKPHEKPQQITTGKIEYEVRLMEPEEAIEISRGAYKSHGYTFFDDNIYYPEQIVELNKTGQMISAVAVSKEKGFMGHAALVYPYLGAQIAELNFIFVNPEYRGQGCMNRLIDFLFQIKKPNILKGVYAYAVTNHIFTQKTMYKFGLVDCGIELATSPATWIFKGIDGDTSQRISVSLSFKYMEPPPSLNLYPPEKHMAMIKKIYSWMNVKNNYMIPEISEPVFTNERSNIETTIHASEGSAEIFINNFGSNIIREIKTLTKDLCIKQMSSITLFLSLEDPMTYFIAPELEKMDYFFSGIMPQTAHGDSLILQYLNNVAFNYDKLMIYTDFGKELVSYIKSCDPYA
ncbi:MAG: GNAT family N-acetyltransferase [Syntrophorhabdaceae bacterium]|nr:GNAT family N-acetyltransferase [Syntrophorhabdaceae bacterium]